MRDRPKPAVIAQHIDLQHKCSCVAIFGIDEAQSTARNRGVGLHFLFQYSEKD